MVSALDLASTSLPQRDLLLSGWSWWLATLFRIKSTTMLSTGGYSAAIECNLSVGLISELKLNKVLSCVVTSEELLRLVANKPERLGRLSRGRFIDRAIVSKAALL